MLRTGGLVAVELSAAMPKREDCPTSQRLTIWKAQLEPQPPRMARWM
jgi:hypothetical protein